MNSRKIFLIILIFSFFIQVFAYTLFKDFEPRSRPTDILCYDAVAKDLLMGKGLTIGRWFPPGYPLYLSFLYKITGVWNYKSPCIHIFSLLLLALTAALCFVIFSHLFDIKAGLISTFIFCIYPLYLFLSTRPGLSEHLFFFVFYLSLWLFIIGIRRKSFFIVFLSGGLLGYASLTKYNTLLYPLIIFLYIMSDKSFKRYKRFLFTVIFFSAYILCITPWFVYLENKGSGSFFNYSAYVAKVDFGTSKKDKKVDLELPKKHKKVDLEVPKKHKIAKFLKSKAKKSIKSLRFLLKKIRKRHPFFIKFCKNLGKSWYATLKGWHSSKILVIQIPIILSAAWGLLVNLANKTYRRNLLFCLFSILYFWILNALTAGIIRIMMIGMPFVFVFSALGIIDIYKRIYSKLRYK